MSLGGPFQASEWPAEVFGSYFEFFGSKPEVASEDHYEGVVGLKSPLDPIGAILWSGWGAKFAGLITHGFF